jgi:hypothetical protein
MTATAYLKSLHACEVACEWAETYADIQAAWDACERSDWMLWLLAKTADRKLVVSMACLCARTALVHVPDGESRPLKAIITAEAWTRGEATIEEVRAARDAAAYADNASVAFYAASDAASTPLGDAAPTYADGAAAHAAYAAARAAYADHLYAYADAVRTAHLKKMSTMIRAEVPMLADVTLSKTEGI